ncbi:MAG: Fe2+ or Zn2+ uptake regulation protein [Planctomycetota bacterium]|jgi:Fe2+ or Zn2+ uptake regulation protein
MRTNTYKQKILSLLRGRHLLSISEICDQVPEADYSTIYRNIVQLTEDNEIKKIILDRDIVGYEINNPEHQHDHFVCTDCRGVTSLKRSTINHPSLTQFLITDILIKGLCQKCTY